MGFDFDYADKATINNRTKQAEPMTFEKARDNSLQDQCAKQLKNWDTGDIMGSNGSPKPSNWFRQDADGQWMVCWRISNKPVYFTPTAEKKKGWLPIKGDKVDEALKSLQKEVDSGKFDKQLREAYNRPARQKSDRKEA